MRGCVGNCDEVAGWRRQLHSFPEIGYEEERTSAFVAGKLSQWGLEVHQGYGKTGLVGVLHGLAGEGRAVALRADMDALPILEKNTFSHCSRCKGMMHACGHDGHTAILLGAAQRLSRDRVFKGRVVFIFQPAEEGLAGAREMIADGLLGDFEFGSVFALHNWPDLPAGMVAVWPGPVMASNDTFQITLFAAGGHGAFPRPGADPIPPAAEMVSALQTVVSRRIGINDRAVLSVTQVNAGSSINVTPREAVIMGTVRAFDDGVRDAVEKAVTEIADGIARAHGVEVVIEYKRIYPPTVNHRRPAALVRRVAEDLLGPENVVTEPAPSAGAEDFAFFLQERSGCYFWLGAGGDRGTHAGLHTDTYDFNDSIIGTGIELLTEVALRELMNNQDQEM